MAPAGTGSIESVPVTFYDVTVDMAKLIGVPGLTAEQRKATREAVTQLASAGYRGTSVKVGIDDAGYIRSTVTVSKFDGGADDDVQLGLLEVRLRRHRAAPR